MFEPGTDGVELQQTNKGWYITRNIPVAMILALGVQLSVIAWTASKYDSRITNQDDRIIAIAHQTQTNIETVNAITQRIARMEGQLEFLVQNAHDVKNALEQKNDRTTNNGR